MWAVSQKPKLILLLLSEGPLPTGNPLTVNTPTLQIDC